jgi:hypothetical protein
MIFPAHPPPPPFYFMTGPLHMPDVFDQQEASVESKNVMVGKQNGLQ